MIIHFVFHSYIELTMKDLERLKREFRVTYEFANIYTCTALPSMMDWFWESNSNERKLTDCPYEYYLEQPMKSEFTIVCNGYLIPKDDA